MASRSDLEFTQLGRDTNIATDPADARVAADAQPDRLDGRFEAPCDGQRTILMEGTVIAK